MAKTFVRSFNAIRDLDGRTVRLNIFIDSVDVGTRADPHATKSGMKELRTDDGTSVNRIDQGVYEIDSPLGAERLTSNEPDRTLASDSPT